MGACHDSVGGDWWEGSRVEWGARGFRELEVFDAPDGNEAVGDTVLRLVLRGDEDVGGEVDCEDCAFDCALGWVGGLDADAVYGEVVSALRAP
jgi:hypothetical protein